MAMSGLSKFFVNREARGLKNFQAIRKHLSTLPREEIQAALVRLMGRDRTSYTFDEILGICSRNHLTIQRQERSMRFIFPQS